MHATSYTPIYRIVYFSEAHSYARPDFYEAIAAQARKANNEAGITGALLKLDGYIVQFLEGPENAVKLLYSKIYRDLRHENPVLLSESWRAARDFPQDDMKFDHIFGDNRNQYRFVLDALDLFRRETSKGHGLSEILLSCFTRTQPGLMTA